MELSNTGTKLSLTAPEVLKLHVSHRFCIFLDKRLVIWETIRRQQPKVSKYFNNRVSENQEG